MNNLLENKLKSCISKNAKVTLKGEPTLRGLVSKDKGVYSITDESKKTTVVEIAKLRAVQSLPVQSLQ